LAQDAYVPTAAHQLLLNALNDRSTRVVESGAIVLNGLAAGSQVAVLGGDVRTEGRLQGRLFVVNGSVDFTASTVLDDTVFIFGSSARGVDQLAEPGRVVISRERLQLNYSDGTYALTAPSPNLAARWWRQRDKWREQGWSELRLASARTYNRVEGLPVLFGPAIGREFDWGRVTVEALSILRSVRTFELTPENVGHSARIELSVGKRYGWRVGARHFDVVDAIEPHQLSETEIGLASFLLHRDFQDYYDRLGGSVYASAFIGSDLDLTLEWSKQRWGARGVRDPWTLTRDAEGWRTNPDVDDGKFRLGTVRFTYDTRSTARLPDNGWFLSGAYEYGTGTITRYGTAPTSPRVQTVGGATSYDRVLLDARKYSRISPGSQLNARILIGGWLSGDQLPMQRRLSVGGPGTLPGYDFRDVIGDHAGAPIDYWQCSRQLSGGTQANGTPAECDRIALAQIEFRGRLNVDPFGLFGGDRSFRRRGWGRGTQFVLYADAGRGWQVGAPDGRVTFRKGVLPPLSTFQTDMGIGVVLDDVGLYLSKALSQSKSPLNFMVRLRPRF
jgi:hypothetical protein